MKKTEVTTAQFDQTKRGIFFRLPVQRVYCDDYTGETECWYIKAKRLIIPILLGNLNVFLKYPKWAQDSNFAGFEVYQLCSPIYFKRTEREAYHLLKHSPIKEIRVWGYDKFKSSFAGEAKAEYATFYFKNGKKKKIKTKGKYKYYYAHVIEDEF